MNLKKTFLLATILLITATTNSMENSATLSSVCQSTTSTHETTLAGSTQSSSSKLHIPPTGELAPHSPQYKKLVGQRLQSPVAQLDHKNRAIPSFLALPASVLNSPLLKKNNAPVTTTQSDVIANALVVKKLQEKIQLLEAEVARQKTLTKLQNSIPADTTHTISPTEASARQIRDDAILIQQLSKKLRHIDAQEHAEREKLLQENAALREENEKYKKMLAQQKPTPQSPSPKHANNRTVLNFMKNT